MLATQTATRSSTSTCTNSRVDTVLDLVCGDLVAFIAQELMTKTTAVDWLKDLTAVLRLEAVERFQVKLKFPNGNEVALDYVVVDDGSIKNSDESGGFSTTFIPKGTVPSLVLRWRKNAPKLAEAQELLRERGWVTGGALLDVTGSPDRAYADGGYGFRRSYAGSWQ